MNTFLDIDFSDCHVNFMSDFQGIYDKFDVGDIDMHHNIKTYKLCINNYKNPTFSYKACYHMLRLFPKELAFGIVLVNAEELQRYRRGTFNSSQYLLNMFVVDVEEFDPTKFGHDTILFNISGKQFNTIDYNILDSEFKSLMVVI